MQTCDEERAAVDAIRKSHPILCSYGGVFRAARSVFLGENTSAIDIARRTHGPGSDRNVVVQFRLR